MKRGWNLFFFGVVCLYFVNLEAWGKEHPFMLFKASDLVALRSRANQSPWKEWKQMALSQADTLTFPVNGSVDDRKWAHRNIAGSCALAYILVTDATKKNLYKSKILNSFTYWPKLFSDIDLSKAENVKINKNNTGEGAAFVISLLALDVIWPDLTSAERTQSVAQLTPPNNSPWPFNWPHNYWGTKLIWAYFREDSAGISLARSEYEAELFGPKGPLTGKGQMTSDGAYTAGAYYSGARMENSFRLGKNLVFDILNFSEGLPYDQRYINLFSWIHTFTKNPFGHHTAFGDGSFNVMSGSQVRNYCYFHTWSAEKLGSDKVSGLASWWRRGCTNSVQYPGDVFLHYVLTRSLNSVPTVPRSALYKSGGAAFWDEDSSPNALMGALWNMDNAEWHTHKETNSIYIAGYGEHLITNAGVPSYTEALVGYPQFGPGWFQRSASSGNTLLIDGVDHGNYGNSGANQFIPAHGNGLSEGLVSQLFDYVSGDSGQALPNGHHQRNFIFIHPQDGVPGYFVLMDEVQANATKMSTMHQLLHPMSNQYSAIVDKQEYQWKINGPFLRDNTRATYINVFLATPPSSVLVKDGAIAGSTTLFIIAKYIESLFPTDSQGRGEILTGLFPHDATHIKPNISRVIASGRTGMVVEHKSNLKDIAFVSRGTSEMNFDGISFKGKGMIARKLNSTALSFYFLREGVFFVAPDKANGVESDSPISLHLRNNSGKISSPGTNVVFYAPQIKSVLIDSKPMSIISQVAGQSMEIFVPNGSFSVKIVTEGQSAKSVPRSPTQVRAIVE